MPKHQLTKTDFLQYLDCPEELWLQKNRPDLLPKITKDILHKVEQGNLIDRMARQLFEEGGMASGKTFTSDQVRFQQQIAHDGYQVIADVTVANPDNGGVAIFEVKASSQVKKEHLYDVAFQKMVFAKSGLPAEHCYLVYLNKKYVFNGAIDLAEFLIVEDLTDQLKDLEEDIHRLAAEALEWINGPMPPKRITLGCSKKLQCPFVKYHFKELPKYTVYDISRIHKNKLKELVTNETLDILEVPLDFPLSTKQRLQVDLAQQEQIIIKKEAIKTILDQLAYPLYFLDYETFSYVIPPQDGHRPYQQMVFQYSLHVVDGPDTPAKHHEYLLATKEEPVEDLVKSLKENIAPSGGTVIVWNKSFEIPRNKELAELFPAYAEFLHSVNERVYDLMDIFRDGLYLHPDFKGSHSIKKVLPVLCPELTYDSLTIQNGNEAVIQWHHMTDGRMGEEEVESVYKALLKYCELDTWAMVRIWEELRATTAKMIKT